MKMRSKVLAPALIAALVAGSGLLLQGEARGAAAAAAATPPPAFAQCRACHTVARGGTNGMGPNLFGIAGSKAAKRPGFTYSPAMSKSGLTWDKTSLDSFLTSPRTKVPGTRMIFPGLPDAAKRNAVVDYLLMLK